MTLKPDQQPALTHQQRVERLQQLTTDLAKAVDLAEEQRRMLRDIARDATELVDALGSSREAPDPRASVAVPEPPRPRRRRAAKKR